MVALCEFCEAKLTSGRDPAGRGSPAGLEVGSFVAVNAPFAADAYRFKNGGSWPAKVACFGRRRAKTSRARRIPKHPGLSYRVVAVDQELGITLLR